MQAVQSSAPTAFADVPQELSGANRSLDVVERSCHAGCIAIAVVLGRSSLHRDDDGRCCAPLTTEATACSVVLSDRQLSTGRDR
jgi:hypothetical protein